MEEDVMERPIVIDERRQEVVQELMLNEETINEGNMKLALLGALCLYLDFINILLRLLSLFGKRK